MAGMGFPRFLAASAAAAWGLGASAPAMAEFARPGQLGFQAPASPSAHAIYDFHNLLLVIITLIAVFVLGLLVYVMFRFAESRNPKPTRTTHNALVEVLWTMIPVVILFAIAWPSFALLYEQEDVSDAEMTLKAIGRQWYWSYEYPDHGNFTFDANLIPDEDLGSDQLRLLSTDNVVVLPVDTKIRILVTASDVLHNFAMPAFGIKMDAVPGRINETWVEITREGTFYGQCSELCGTGHAYMPIEIHAVSKAAFEDWVEQAREEFATLAPDDGDSAARPTQLAATPK